MKINTTKEHSSTKERLVNLRRKIDTLDKQIVKLLDRRAGLVFSIGEWKRKNGVAVRDSRREARIFERIRRQNRLFLSDAEIKLCYRQLISFFRQLESRRLRKPNIRKRKL